VASFLLFTLLDYFVCFAFSKDTIKLKKQIFFSQSQQYARNEIGTNQNSPWATENTPEPFSTGLPPKKMFFICPFMRVVM